MLFPSARGFFCRIEYSQYSRVGIDNKSTIKKGLHSHYRPIGGLGGLHGRMDQAASYPASDLELARRWVQCEGWQGKCNTAHLNSVRHTASISSFKRPLITQTYEKAPLSLSAQFCNFSPLTIAKPKLLGGMAEICSGSRWMIPTIPMTMLGQKTSAP